MTWQIFRGLSLACWRSKSTPFPACTALIQWRWNWKDKVGTFHSASTPWIGFCILHSFLPPSNWQSLFIWLTFRRAILFAHSAIWCQVTTCSCCRTCESAWHWHWNWFLGNWIWYVLSGCAPTAHILIFIQRTNTHTLRYMDEFPVSPN